MKKWWLSKDSSKSDGLRWKLSDKTMKIWKSPSVVDEVQTEVAAGAASFASKDASKVFVPMTQYAMSPHWDYEKTMPTNDVAQYSEGFIETPERLLSPERSLQNLLRAEAPEFTFANVGSTIELTQHQ